nr:hypothetical protein L203_06050 [Cryptococcus depauperatus CBS 7841]
MEDPDRRELNVRPLIVKDNPPITQVSSSQNHHSRTSPTPTFRSSSRISLSALIHENSVPHDVPPQVNMRPDYDQRYHSGAVDHDSTADGQHQQSYHSGQPLSGASTATEISTTGSNSRYSNGSLSGNLDVPVHERNRYVNESYTPSYAERHSLHFQPEKTHKSRRSQYGSSSTIDAKPAFPLHRHDDVFPGNGSVRNWNTTSRTASYQDSFSISRPPYKKLRPNSCIAGCEDIWERNLVHFQSKRELEARVIADLGNSPLLERSHGVDLVQILPQTQNETKGIRQHPGADTHKKRIPNKALLHQENVEPALSFREASSAKQPASHSYIRPANLTLSLPVISLKGQSGTGSSSDVAGLSWPNIDIPNPALSDLRPQKVQTGMGVTKTSVFKDGNHSIERKTRLEKGWSLGGATENSETYSRYQSESSMIMDLTSNAIETASISEPDSPSQAHYTFERDKQFKRRTLQGDNVEFSEYADLDNQIGNFRRPSNSPLRADGNAEESDVTNVGAPYDFPTQLLKKKSSKTREPGVGKGRWTRPKKPEKDLVKKAEELASLVSKGPFSTPNQSLPEDFMRAHEQPPSVASAFLPPPNSHDPRGVSKHEAGIRVGLVEDLQSRAWKDVVRDVPRVYRVFQGYEQAARQVVYRKAHASVRNGLGQRSFKSAQRPGGRAAKEGAAKARRVVKELASYWRKNEKDELVARKKAEREALERAKLEEEKRETKRQSRKLNFLLTQTELYSHFIEKKIKTREAEAIEGVETAEIDREEWKNLENTEDAEVAFDKSDIDYDDDDEETLRKHAARGAKAAVQATKDKAKAFDQANKSQALNGDQLTFHNPSLGQNSVIIKQPAMLMAQLKEYQLKGLTWLGNLYEQGINGILADEMGLGKTIQSISLLAYLAEVHNLWGPFLVIAPASTLHNWQQELARFVPDLKSLPYWGAPRDREVLRKIWNRKNQTFDKESPFHIVVTSYQLAVQDEKYLQSLKWQYMILDEAQAIKSSSSARWKSLLSLRCRNRLLLTGTPIQNSMQELWALLHFIMPQLFDSHEEFAEWFSKDIESSSGGVTGSLKPEQLKRLHMILKPFMLRRVKKHVQKELGDKIEIDLLVDLSNRQRSIYKALRQCVSISDLLATSNDSRDQNDPPKSMRSLVNIVMQFRKVCNHPDLFERADAISSYSFGNFLQTDHFTREGDQIYLPDSGRNPITFTIPKTLWVANNAKLDIRRETPTSGADTNILRHLLSIWSPEWINERIKQDNAEFGWTKILNLNAGDLSRELKTPLFSRCFKIAKRQSINNFELSSTKGNFRVFKTEFSFLKPSHLAFNDIAMREWTCSFLSRSNAHCIVKRAVAPPIVPYSAVHASDNGQKQPFGQLLTQSVLDNFACNFHAATPFPQPIASICSTNILPLSSSFQLPVSTLHIPPAKRLVVDSGKLARLDTLLQELKSGGHRVLLYFQMTRMMDLIEEYLIYRQYKYLRLDGSSSIAERRDMVTSWQTNPDIFVFCLSTRAGGLGINLTAADTVIFYDHDWNPSSDAQAMDRAHRVGQTKQVTVYRLIARGTIEERILRMARGKKDVQDIVVGSKSMTDIAKPSEIVSLFMDDEELAESVAKRKQAEAHGFVAPSGPQDGKTPGFEGALGLEETERDDGFFDPVVLAQADEVVKEKKEETSAKGTSKGKPKIKGKDKVQGV